MEEVQGQLITVDTLADDFRRLGIHSGMTLLVHSSFKALGQWVAGGPVAVILALEQVLGEEGTLVMPTQSSDLTDPEGWSNPPVPREWWPEIRGHMPPYDPDLTPLRGMGIIPECFRKQKGVRRSLHPLHSFAAWGKHRDFIVDGHELEFGFGEHSPLARMTELKGNVLLLGVSSENNTTLHLAEHRASYPGKDEVVSGAPMLVDGERQWVRYRDTNWDSGDFEELGEAFGEDTGLIRHGRIAAAKAQLMPQQELVEYGIRWLEQNRKAAD